MTIGMILFAGASFPPDIRVDKECRALVKAGHRIVVLTAQFADQPVIEKTELYTIIRVSIAKRILNDPLSFFTLYYRMHAGYIARFIDEYRPDVLHVHDFDLLPTVIAVNRGRVPVIADLHENGPASFVAFRANDLPLKRLLRAILYNYRLWKTKEKRYLPQCSRVIVVVPEAAERVVQYGVPAERIAIVSNTESKETFPIPAAPPPRELLEKYKNAWVISYIGGLGPHRGLDTVIKALPIASKTIPNLRLVIVGARGKEVRIISHWSAMAGLSEAVEVIEWLPFEQVHNYLQISRAALVPHNDFEHTQTTVPHKLFQYMLAGIPVLVSDCRPLKRIIGDMGYVFQAGNPVSCAEMLCRMYSHPDEAKKKSARAKEAALGPWSWDNDAERLLNVYSF